MNDEIVQETTEAESQNNTDTIETINTLSDEHSLFLDYYLQSFNGTKSYMKVYPDSSEEAAAASASRLLRNDNIIEEKNRRINEIRKNIPNEIIPYLKNQINFNIADFLNKDGKPDMEKIKNNPLPGLVSSVIVKEDTYRQGDDAEIIKTNISFKLIDQQKSIEILSKILKLYEDTITLKVNYDQATKEFIEKHNLIKRAE